MASILYSIVIPTCNRPNKLKNCLYSISKINFSKTQFEVVVVDDGSHISSESVVHSFQRSLQIQYITQTNAGPAAARNNGAAHAKGKIIIFTDDDCEPHINWLQDISNHYAKHTHALLGGRVLNKLNHNLFATTSQCLIDYLYNYYNHNNHNPFLLTSNNLAVPKIDFMQTGQFDTSFPMAAGEDREFSYRWYKKEKPAFCVEDAIIYHSHHLNLNTFWKQHFNYGQGAWRFHQIIAEKFHTKIAIEPINFYFNLIYKGPGHETGLRRFFIILLLITSQFANAAGFYFARSLKKTRN